MEYVGLVESEGQDFDGLYEGHAEQHGSATASCEADAVHVPQRARIPLNSLLARTASQERAGPGAVHGAIGSQG